MKSGFLKTFCNFKNFADYAVDVGTVWRAKLEIVNWAKDLTPARAKAIMDHCIDNMEEAGRIKLWSNSIYRIPNE